MFDFISKLIYRIIYIFGFLGFLYYSIICLATLLCELFSEENIVVTFFLIIAWYIIYKHEKDNKKD